MVPHTVTLETFCKLGASCSRYSMNSNLINLFVSSSCISCSLLTLKHFEFPDENLWAELLSCSKKYPQIYASSRLKLISLEFFKQPCSMSSAHGLRYANQPRFTCFSSLTRFVFLRSSASPTFRLSIPEAVRKWHRIELCSAESVAFR